MAKKDTGDVPSNIHPVTLRSLLERMSMMEDQLVTIRQYNQEWLIQLSPLLDRVGKLEAALAALTAGRSRED